MLRVWVAAHHDPPLEALRWLIARLIYISIIVVGSGQITYGDIRDMPITGNLLEITLRMVFLAQRIQTVGWYTPAGGAFSTATPAGVGEAWWNDVKTVWRALGPSSSGLVFDTVFVREYNGAGGYGEFAIPTAERSGTRTVGTLGDFLPPYVADAVKLTVATNLTRPGQKRFPFAMEGDNENGLIVGTRPALVNAVAAKYVGPLTLGAPVATGTLNGVVVKKTGVPPIPAQWQAVQGAVLNPYFSSQNSRKIGRGQ